MRDTEEHSKTETRRNKIIRQLMINGMVTNSELCALLNASESTIRNDLKAMDSSGLLTRTYGGAVLNNNTRYNIPMNTRYGLHSLEKDMIAKMAVESLLSDGMTIALDSGTTAVSLAKQIVHSSVRLTVITTSLAVAEVLSRTSYADVYLAGGKLNSIKQAFIDASAVEFIRSMASDISFISCDGIDPDRGLSMEDPQEVDVKRAMAESSKKVVAIADSSKIGVVKLKNIFPCEELDCFVTDSHASSKELTKIGTKGVEIILA